LLDTRLSAWTGTRKYSSVPIADRPFHVAHVGFSRNFSTSCTTRTTTLPLDLDEYCELIRTVSQPTRQYERSVMPPKTRCRSKLIPTLSKAATPTSSLLSALLSVLSTPPRIIQSPPTQPRRASVALVLRLRPPPGLEIPKEQWGVGMGLDEFFRLRECDAQRIEIGFKHVRR
jgi:hypothetical protein